MTGGFSNFGIRTGWAFSGGITSPGLAVDPLFAVDASGSMAARKRMSAVTGAVISLLLDAYQRRDKVGLITFRGGTADLVLPPTSSVEAAVARLRGLGTGGRTPLALG